MRKIYSNNIQLQYKDYCNLSRLPTVKKLQIAELPTTSSSKHKNVTKVLFIWAEVISVSEKTFRRVYK